MALGWLWLVRGLFRGWRQAGGREGWKGGWREGGREVGEREEGGLARGQEQGWQEPMAYRCGRASAS